MVSKRGTPNLHGFPHYPFILLFARGFQSVRLLPPKSFGNNGLKCIDTSRTGLRFAPAYHFSAGSSTFFQVSSGLYLIIAVAIFGVFFPRSFW